MESRSEGGGSNDAIHNPGGETGGSNGQARLLVKSVMPYDGVGLARGSTNKTIKRGELGVDAQVPPQRHTQFECMNEPPQCQVISAATCTPARSKTRRRAHFARRNPSSTRSFTPNARIMPPLPEEARVHTASLATPSMEYPSNCTHAMRLTCVRAVHRPELARATDHFPAGIRGG